MYQFFIKNSAHFDGCDHQDLNFKFFIGTEKVKLTLLCSILQVIKVNQSTTFLKTQFFPNIIISISERSTLMQRLKKEIHTAFFHVSQLCDQFFRKYPQHHPVQPSQFDSYSPYNIGMYPPLNNQFIPPVSSPWTAPFDGKNPAGKQKTGFTSDWQLSSKMNDSKFPKSEKPKKNAKDEKKYEKKLDLLRKQREQQFRKKLKETEKRKKERNTLKNQIKRDSRYALKPKFPMSPYFLFLQAMRKTPPTDLLPGLTNKQFAEEMGRRWKSMVQEQKMPYITTYLKSKRIYDEEINKFYAQYPDLKPKANGKQEKPMYAVDDPKYKIDALPEEQELESDLIDELNSEQEKSLNQNPDNYNDEDEEKYETKIPTDEEDSLMEQSVSPTAVMNGKNFTGRDSAEEAQYGTSGARKDSSDQNQQGYFQQYVQIDCD